MKLGEKVLKCREFLGLTQEELAKKSNLTPAAICQIEKGSRIPNFASAIKIIVAIGIKPDKFLEDVDDYGKEKNDD